MCPGRCGAGSVSSNVHHTPSGRGRALTTTPVRVATTANNDWRIDSRVVREAGMLARHGYEVTVVFRRESAAESVEENNGVRYICVPRRRWSPWEIFPLITVHLRILAADALSNHSIPATLVSGGIAAPASGIPARCSSRSGVRSARASDLRFPQEASPGPGGDVHHAAAAVPKRVRGALRPDSQVHRSTDRPRTRSHHRCVCLSWLPGRTNEPVFFTTLMSSRAEPTIGP